MHKYVVYHSVSFYGQSVNKIITHCLQNYKKPNIRNMNVFFWKLQFNYEYIKTRNLDSDSQIQIRIVALFSTAQTRISSIDRAGIRKHSRQANKIKWQSSTYFHDNVNPVLGFIIIRTPCYANFWRKTGERDIQFQIYSLTKFWISLMITCHWTIPFMIQIWFTLN